MSNITEEKSANLDLDLENAIKLFRRRMFTAFQKEAQRLKCPISHWEALGFIATREKASMKEVAEHLHITPPSVTEIIDALTKNGLLTRSVGRTDRRTIFVSLAPRALETLRVGRSSRLAMISKIFKKLTIAEKQQLIRIFRKLTTD
jgi:DNA-binding MarR family transcriptional regulator